MSEQNPVDENEQNSSKTGGYFDGADSGLSDPSDTPPTESTTTNDQSKDDSNDINLKELPLKIRRNNVKEHRPTQITVAIQTETKQKISEAQSTLEMEFEGEDVKRMDVYELLMIVGANNEDELIETAREMGYGLTE